MEDRYARQLWLPEIGAAGQARMAQTRVLLVGVGGLGSPVAQYLVGMGIGTLGLVDDDVVSVSNLHRQILYSEQQVGQPKVACAAARLRSLNSEVGIEEHPGRFTPEVADAMLASYDMVVDGCDNFATRFAIDEACARRGIPYIYGAVCGFEGQASVFHYGDHPHTYRTLHPDKDAVLAMPHPGKAVIGMTPGVVGCVMAAQVLQLATGAKPSLAGQLWTIDLRTMEAHTFQLP
ncbi:MAG: HesA/MoeB/ThiF family protein [Bacteroidales bacterium]|nr:HesA/MoeB/ThiF family protein [Bacteroidales bacterium]